MNPSSQNGNDKRLEGRNRACEGLLAARFGKRKTDAGAKAIAQLKQSIGQPAAAFPDILETEQLDLIQTGNASTKLFRMYNPRTLYHALAMAASLTLLLSAYFYYNYLSLRSAPCIIAKLKGHGISIIRDGVAVKAEDGMKIKLGDKVMVPQSASVMLQITGNQSVLELGERSRFQWTLDATKMELTEGRLRASFIDSINRIISTPNGMVSVEKSEFILVAKSDSTWLKVNDGLVRLNRKSDAASIELGPYQYAVSAPGVQLAALSENERWQTPYQITQTLLATKTP